MVEKLKKLASVVEDDEAMTVELCGRTDDSAGAESRSERIAELIAKMTLLGRTRGRPRKEDDDEEIAA